MASIRKRKYTKGFRWEVRVRRPPNRTLCRTFSLKADAEAWAMQTERSIERREIDQLASADETVLTVVRRYESEVTPRKRGRDVEAVRLRKFASSELAQIRLSMLRPSHIIQYRDQRLSEVSSGTVKKELVLLGTVIEVARSEWGIALANNPVRLIKKPTENPQRQRRLEPVEITRLFEATRISRNIYFSGIVELAVETAMRRGELLTLRWCDVDLLKKTAHLPLTKNGSPRTIPLSTRAVAILEQLPVSISGQVFPIGKPALRGLWLRSCVRAELVDLHFHDLRHEATSRFFEKGLNVMEVAAITGHKDLRMLQRYTHLRAEELARKLG